MMDSHTHCNFSHDSTENAEELIKKALQLGLEYIAITDHCDKDLVELRQFDWIRQIDLPKRFDTINSLKQKYQDKIQVAVGLELGYRASAKPLYIDILDKYPTDFIINSIHIVDDEDCYYPEFFAKRTRNQAYSQYLTAVRNSLDCGYHYDSVGHIGYVIRKSPYDNYELDYATFGGQLDDILMTIIAKNKALEVNSSLNKGGSNNFLPSIEILQRYKQLGGELITFGSDSHSRHRVGDKYTEITKTLSSLGFRYVFKYLDHNPIGVKI